MDEQPKNMKIVWTITERTTNGATKSFWTRVGVGFVNRDGSISLRLDCIPISGTLQVREWEPMDRQKDASPNPNEPPPRARPRAPAAGPASDGLI
jgi:hypothetical protein